MHFASEFRGPDRAAAFRRAAEAFASCLDKFGITKSEEDGRSLNILREELAFCYIFTENSELRSKAEDIYRDLLIIKPDSISVLLRLGQLCRDAGSYSEAKTLMEDALAVAARQPEPDAFELPQANWLLRRDLAYIYWRISELKAEEGEALSLLQRAVELSYEALKFARPETNQRLFVQQNLLYYLVDLWSKSPENAREEVSNKGKQLLHELRNMINQEWSIEDYDTIARAESVFGDDDRAKGAARLVIYSINLRIDAIRKERKCSYADAFEVLSRDEKRMFLFATGVLSPM